MTDTLPSRGPFQADLESLFAEVGCMESFLSACAEELMLPMSSFGHSIKPLPDSSDERHFSLLGNVSASPPFSQYSPCSQESDSVTPRSTLSDRAEVSLSIGCSSVPWCADEDLNRVLSEADDIQSASPEKEKLDVPMGQKRLKIETTSLHAAKRSKYDAQKVHEDALESLDFAVACAPAIASDEEVKAKRASLLEMGNQALYDLLVSVGGPSRHKAKTARRYVVEEIMCRLFSGRGQFKSPVFPSLVWPLFLVPFVPFFVSSAHTRYAIAVPNLKLGSSSRSAKARGYDLLFQGFDGASRFRRELGGDSLRETSDCSDSDYSLEERFFDPNSDEQTDIAELEHCRNELTKLSHAELCRLLHPTDPAATDPHLFAKRPLVDYVMHQKQIKDLVSLDAFFHENPYDASKASQATRTAPLVNFSVILRQLLDAALAKPAIRSFTDRIQSFFLHVNEGELNAILTLETLARKASEGQYHSSLELESDVDAMLSKTEALGVLSSEELAQYNEIIRAEVHTNIRNSQQDQKLGSRPKDGSAQALLALPSACLSADQPSLSLHQGRMLNPQDLPWIEVAGTRYYRSEHAYLRGPDPQGLPWIGRIEKIFQTDCDTQLEIRWCTSTLHDRQLRASLQSSSKRELFLLDGPGCTDNNSYKTLNGKPVVMYAGPDSFKKSRRLKDPKMYYVYRTLHLATRIVENLPRKVKAAPKITQNPVAAGGSPIANRPLVKTSSWPCIATATMPQSINCPLIKISSPSSCSHNQPHPEAHQPHPSPSFPYPFYPTNICVSDQGTDQSAACHVDPPANYVLPTSGHVIQSDVVPIDHLDTCHSPMAPLSEPSPSGFTNQYQHSFASDQGLRPSPFWNQPPCSTQLGLTFPADESGGLYNVNPSPWAAAGPLAASDTPVFLAVGLLRSMAAANQISKEEEILWIRLAVTGHEGFVALARFYGEDYERFINIARTSFPAVYGHPWA